MKKQKNPIYSIGMIFKNEIRCLERCLKSLQPLRDAVPCELVMADTGSSDGSREVAAKYADILFDFPWCDDFSAARNAVMDRCSGVWYFSIDADEWLDENVTELIQFAKSKKLNRDFAAFTIRNYQAENLGEFGNYMDFSAIRLARLGTGIRYSGCIHESWTSKDGSIEAMMLDKTLVYHDGYVYRNKEAAEAKRKRNVTLLEKKLAENPDDLQTLVECVDSTKEFDDVSMEYAKRAMEGIDKKWKNWEKAGPTVFRNAVSVASTRKKPELLQWAEEAVKRYPKSIYTYVDVAYYAFCRSWDKNDYAACVRWGEMYRAGIADYEAGRFDQSETLRGTLEYSSPYWQRRLWILLSEAYINQKEYEKALALFDKIHGETLDETNQVEACANILMRLQRVTDLDASARMSAFWEQIQRPEPSEETMKLRRGAFLSRASFSFNDSYQAEELERPDFRRHSYTVFAVLGDSCPCGIAASILTTEEPEALTKLLAAVDDWDGFPVTALIHALKHGARFPVGGKTLAIEEMDRLAARIAENKESVCALAEQINGDSLRDGPSICWARGVALAAAQVFPWAAEDADEKQGIAVARAFARAEKAFLPLCYRSEALTEQGLFLLPPVHRFGWYCAQAFETLDRGDAVGYVRLLREGLAANEGAKDMAAFLTDHTPELHAPEPSAEMKALAEQIRMVLSRFAPDDPAIAVLKQSEAYQMVAGIIGGEL